MGLFSKKEDNRKELPSLPSLPKLPELPGLPDFDDESDVSLGSINQLPTFPTNSMGEKFSQHTIKEAVIGGKEGEKNSFASAFAPMRIEAQTMQKPIKRTVMREEVPEEFREAAIKVKRSEPIFIRIDKFEDSLKTFNKIKEEMSEIEEMLHGIKELREKEDEELAQWESNVQTMKTKVEKVDKDLFSTIE